MFLFQVLRRVRRLQRLVPRLLRRHHGGDVPLHVRVRVRPVQERQGQLRDLLPLPTAIRRDTVSMPALLIVFADHKSAAAEAERHFARSPARSSVSLPYTIFNATRPPAYDGGKKFAQFKKQVRHGHGRAAAKDCPRSRPSRRRSTCKSGG